MAQHVITLAPDGTIRSLWTDRLDLRQFGRIRVTRASNVEFDEQTQEWVATTPEGRVLAHGPNRQKVIEGEIAALQEAL